MNDDQRKWLYWAIPIVVVVGLGTGLYYARTHKPAVENVAQMQAPPLQSLPEPIRNPIGEAPEEQSALPELSASDDPMLDSLSALFGRTLEPYLVPNNLIRNVVVTIDNLPRKKTALQRHPLKPTAGDFIAGGVDQLTLSKDNYARYAPLVKIAQNTDSAQIAAIYRRFYPLFQGAYVDLGYPDGYFNDRLVEVIDHLLETPEVPDPIRLTHPSVHYEFADPTLEQRSAGQKLLIRMGAQNAAVVKIKLRQLRSAVAKQQRTEAEQPTAPDMNAPAGR